MELLNIHYLVQEFYAIEAITAMLAVKRNNRFEPMRHSHSRWYRDFTDFRNEYIKQFASVIYDYTAMVVAAELRHCRDKASYFINGYYGSDMSRDSVYHGCTEYNAHDILQAGIRMFDTKLVEWDRGYGGDKWYQIAKAGLMKGKVSDCVFIDHCVDLSHNNSVYFDKGAGIFYLECRGWYQTLLNLKFSCKPQVLLHEKLGYAFRRLLWRANNLSVIRKKAARICANKKKSVKISVLALRDESENLLFRYQPVKWGDKRLDCSESNIIIQLDFHRKAESRREEYLRSA